MKQSAKQRYVKPNVCVIPIAYENQSLGFLLGSETKGKAQINIKNYANDNQHGGGKRSYNGKRH